jgi:coatomer subunit alpha
MLQRTMQHSNPQAGDIFGNTDAIVKYVLEGHDRGVNWVSFHPTLPLLVSAGDDRLIKIWRMSETKAWEVDTCRGHSNNASAALFHKSQDLILSVGEDKTIRVWDANKRTAVQSFRRENDRFWVIAAHPTINLFAAGHDNGVMVFKLERERPAHSVHQNTLLYVTRDKFIKSFDLNTSTESSNLISLRKLGQPWNPPRSISYNPADGSVLVSSSVDGGTYEFVNLPREGGSLVDSSEAKKGNGTSAVWVARNRFAVFTKDAQTIDIKDLNNSVTRTIKVPQPGVMDIHYGGTGNLLLCTQTQVILYDIQKKEIIAELTTPFVKYVYWNAAGSQVALLGKHTITIANKNLEQIGSIHETIRIKSAVWDDQLEVLLYNTFNHVKYLLPSAQPGDTGVIRSLGSTVYLIRVRGKSLTCLTREGKCEVVDIDPTEYRFKVALAKKEYKEMVRTIKTSNLVGQSIIGYLQKKGYPEVCPLQALLI